MRGERPVVLLEADATDPAATGPAIAAARVLAETVFDRDLTGPLAVLTGAAAFTALVFSAAMLGACLFWIVRSIARPILRVSEAMQRLQIAFELGCVIGGVNRSEPDAPLADAAARLDAATRRVGAVVEAQGRHHPPAAAALEHHGFGLRVLVDVDLLERGLGLLEDPLGAPAVGAPGGAVDRQRSAADAGAAGQPSDLGLRQAQAEDADLASRLGQEHRRQVGAR